MGRKQQIRELQIAEAEVVLCRQQLQQCARQRIDHLRALGPYWLIGGGLVAGVVVQRGDALLGGHGAGSSLSLVLRLWSLLSAGLSSGLAASDALK
ncbi:hypothetical protein [Haliea sp.]